MQSPNQNEETVINLENGKYTVIHKNGTEFRALRYGKEWRDLTGDGLVLAMAQEISDLRDQLHQTSIIKAQD